MGCDLKVLARPGSAIFVLALVSVWAAAAARSQEVCPKYSNCVDISDYNCEEIDHSSFIKTVCYRTAGGVLLLRLGNSWYKYCNVEQEVAAEVVTATSPGSVYNSKVKVRASGTRYLCE